MFAKVDASPQKSEVNLVKPLSERLVVRKAERKVLRKGLRKIDRASIRSVAAPPPEQRRGSDRSPS